MPEQPAARPPLGAQLWIEQDDDPARVRCLVSRAAEAGLGLIRVFLMWPWIEPEPAHWEFGVFDAAFEAAAGHGIGVKATLTANSGPWHVGMPGVLHSNTLTLDSGQRPAMRRYVQRCVRRYRDHRALAQWILWNEPYNGVVPPGRPNPSRSDELRALWAALLRERYGGGIGRLNRRWRSGYTDFAEVPFAEDVAHPAHRGSVWESYGPWLDDWRLRVRALRRELEWVADVVRADDPSTPLCFNPPGCLDNAGMTAFGFTELAGLPDVLGASFHASWHLAFAGRHARLPVLCAGTTLLARSPGVRRVEVTELQLGNTYYGGRVPLGVEPGDAAASFLAPLLVGAESVTGWCLNTRRQDFEAGDWGLLDDDDRLGERAAAARRAGELLGVLEARTGGWVPQEPAAVVLVDETSQAVQMVAGFPVPPVPGRGLHDASHGSALIAAELLRLGVPTAMAPASGLGDWRGPDPRLLVVSHMTAWTPEAAAELLRRVADGATLLLDATSGHKDHDARLHRPWPGTLATELGFRCTGLEVRADGYPVTSHHRPCGRLPLVVGAHSLSDPAWWSHEHLRLPEGGAAPLVWERPYRRGRVVLVAGPLAPALLYDDRFRPLARELLAHAGAGIPRPVRPLSQDTVTLAVRGRRRDAVGVFAPPARASRCAWPCRPTPTPSCGPPAPCGPAPATSSSFPPPTESPSWCPTDGPARPPPPAPGGPPGQLRGPAAAAADLWRPGPAAGPSDRDRQQRALQPLLR
jgi:Beta-galactosidase